MNATILFAAIYIFFLLIAIFSSYNHMVRANISLTIGAIVVIILYLLDGRVFNNSLRFLCYDFSNSTTNPIITNLFDNEIASLGAIFTLIFTVSYFLTRILLHYTLVGTNPSIKASRGLKTLYGLNICYYLLICFVLTTLFATFLLYFLDLKPGSFSSLFRFIQERVSL